MKNKSYFKWLLAAGGIVGLFYLARKAKAEIPELPTGEGYITGAVYDGASGNPYQGLYGVEVLVSGRVVSTTDAAGIYRVPMSGGIAAGSYMLTFRKAGYIEQTNEAVVLEVGRTDLTLTLLPISSEIVVSGLTWGIAPPWPLGNPSYLYIPWSVQVLAPAGLDLLATCTIYDVYDREYYAFSGPSSRFTSSGLVQTIAGTITYPPNVNLAGTGVPIIYINMYNGPILLMEEMPLVSWG